ncbi:MAG: DUF4118 domain-containing protein [Acidimicrobiales bacterium]
MTGAKRGRLEIFLGAAPAAGKTYASLQEAQRLRDQGTDVVVGCVETHGRGSLLEQLGGLVVIPPRRVSYKGRYFDELDLPSLIERHPHTVVVDELAHSNLPGLAHEKRWQDVDQLLEAGIDVISNLNVQHLASLTDEAERITERAQRETVPDELIASAARIDLVSVDASVLRERLTAGEIFEAGVATTALAGYFSAERLDALDALARRWMVDHGRAEAPGDQDPVGGGAESSPSSRRLVAVLSDAPGGERLLRRAAEIAKSTSSELVGLRVRGPSNPTRSEPPWLQGQRRLLTELGGRYAEVGAEDVAGAVLRFAETERAEHLVVAATGQSRLYRLTHGSVVNDVVKAARDLEVHIVPVSPLGSRPDLVDGPDPARPRPRFAVRATRGMPDWHRRRSELPASRRLVAFVLALAAPAIVAGGLAPFRASVGLPGTLMMLLLAVTLVAGVGGFGPAALATTVGILLADYYLTHPLHSFAIDQTNAIFALIAFAADAAVVSILVNVLINEGVVGARRRAVADGLARLAADSLVAAGSQALPNTLNSLRRTLSLDGVAVLRAEGSGWEVEAASGERIPLRPEEAASFVEVGEGRVLVLAEGSGIAEEADLMQAFMSEIRFEQERIQLERIRRLRGPEAPGT